MKNKTCLVIIFLLSSFLFISVSYASNISLVNSICVHEFYSSDEEVLISEGQFIIRNQDNEATHIRLSVSNDLNEGDMGSNGEPRKHTVSPYIYFYPLPDTSWVVFEDNYFEIPGNSEYLVTYHLNIPVNELPEYVNTTNGFLGYINIVAESLSGQSVGVNYQHKLFVEFKEGFELPIPLLHVIAILLVSTLLILLVIKLRLRETQKVKRL